jgi:hypothetical protein
MRLWCGAGVTCGSGAPVELGATSYIRCTPGSRHSRHFRRLPLRAQPVWKLKIPKLDENDILVFDFEIEWACNASTSNGLE